MKKVSVFTVVAIASTFFLASCGDTTTTETTNIEETTVVEEAAPVEEVIEEASADSTSTEVIAE